MSEQFEDLKRLAEMRDKGDIDHAEYEKLKAQLMGEVEDTTPIINELGSDDKGLGAADFDFVLGNPGDNPFVGDFDGDDVDEVGLYRATTGLMYFRNTLTTGIADRQFYYGNPGDHFVAGDWGKEDGTDSPGIFRPTEARFYLKYEVAEGVADESFTFGKSPWLPIAGNWFTVAAARGD